MTPELVPIDHVSGLFRPRRILQLPRELDLEQMLALIRAESPAAVMPAPAPPVTTARTASMLRDHLAGCTKILIPLPDSARHGFRTLLGALRRDGFNNFAFPPMMGAHDIVQLVHFTGAPTFREGDWYHLAYGRNPGDITAPGTWTWSEEIL